MMIIIMTRIVTQVRGWQCLARRELEGSQWQFVRTVLIAAAGEPRPDSEAVRSILTRNNGSELKNKCVEACHCFITFFFGTIVQELEKSFSIVVLNYLSSSWSLNQLNVLFNGDPDIESSLEASLRIFL